jgi:hypothetical protein
LRGICITVFTSLVFLAGICTAGNITWTEVGDAGNNLPSAQGIPGSGSLVRILGTLSAPGDATGLVDVFAFRITDPLTFSATTSGSIPDPELFLFNSQGYGVKGNDDLSASSKQSQLGGFSGSPGIYYLWISVADRDPGNGVVAIFPGPGLKGVGFMVDPVPGAGKLTGPVGGALPVNNGGNFAYAIDFTSAAPIPEPSTMGAGLIGLALLFADRRTRKRG